MISRRGILGVFAAAPVAAPAAAKALAEASVARCYEMSIGGLTGFRLVGPAAGGQMCDFDRLMAEGVARDAAALERLRADGPWWDQPAKLYSADEPCVEVLAGDRVACDCRQCMDHRTFRAWSERADPTLDSMNLASVG
jgi:hypothetical protein